MKQIFQPLSILIFLGILSFSHLIAQNPSPIMLKYGYDVQYYFLDFEIKMASHRLNGAVDIHFTALQKLSKIKVDLDQKLKVEEITSNGEVLKFKHKKDVINISLSQSMEAGEKGSIKISYKGYPQNAMNPPWLGGMVWGRDDNNDPVIGVACQTDGAHVWWPVKNDLRDEPDSMKIRITLPKTGFSCISNGHLLDKQTMDGKEIFTWKTNYPINVYNVTFYVGKYKQFSIPYENEEGDHKVDFYVMPDNFEYAQNHFLQIRNMIRMMETLFGEYPWWKDECKIIESPYAGMEHQTAIAMGTAYHDDEEFDFDDLLIHELAHEWWGNSVTVGDFSDIWIQEGFATYCEALYAEVIGGKEAYLKYMDRLMGRISGFKPMNAPFKLGSRGFESDQYFKGAAILHTLRNAIQNDIIFFDILKTFYQENKYGITSSDAFVEVVNRKTGKNFNSFFEIYLTKTGLPILFWSHKFNKEENHYVLKLKWENQMGTLLIPLEIYIDGNPVKLFLQPGLNTFTVLTDERIRFNEDYALFKAIKNNKLK